MNVGQDFQQGRPGDPTVSEDDAVRNHLPGTGREVALRGDGPVGHDHGDTVGEGLPTRQGDRAGAGPVTAVFGRFPGGMGAGGIAAALGEMFTALTEIDGTPAINMPRQHGRSALADRYADAIEASATDDLEAGEP